VPGYGHAETAAKPALIDRIGSWAQTVVLADGGLPSGQLAIPPDVLAEHQA
jgi:hypothetical protein